MLMGSGCEAVRRNRRFARLRDGEKVGVVKVRLYRPFDAKAFVNMLADKRQRRIAVLDRTKEPGAAAEPLYLDCVNALYEQRPQRSAVVGGRYGLSSKEFTPGDGQSGVRQSGAVVAEKPFHGRDRRRSLAHQPGVSIRPSRSKPDDVVRAQFFGLGSDGTVGANKESIKIIGENTDNFAQGYFVYDSKKSGAMTISHLRFGPRPIKSTYLITRRNFVACHQPFLLETYDVLRDLAFRAEHSC